MRFTTPKNAFLLGLRDGAPFIVVALPFAMLFGVLASEAGLTVTETMGFSVVVIAGAAQFTALQLMVEDTPTLLVLLSALAVNLRVAMYSAALTPYLGGAPFRTRLLAAYFLVDQSYALSHATFEERPDMTLRARVGYYFGTCALVSIAWYIGTYVGAVAGNRMGFDIPLDFALPCMFLAMLGPMLRTLPHMAAAVVAGAVALIAMDLPYSLGLMLGGLAGMMTGATLEGRLTARTGS